MVIVDYLNNKYIFTFDNSDIGEDHESEKQMFRELHIPYDYNLFAYYATPEGTEEIIQWFKHYKYSFRFIRIAKKEFDSYLQEKYNYSTLFLDKEDKLTFDFLKNVTPFNYQIEGVNFCRKRKVSLIADAAGLGKSLQGVITYTDMLLDKEIEKIFIITRSSLLYQWKKEFLDYTTVFNEEDFVLITNERKKDGISNYKDKRIFLIADHLLSDFVLWETRGIIPRKQSNLRWNNIKLLLQEKLETRKIGLIIDEAHHFKNPKSVMSKALRSISESFVRKLFLTATPAINSFLDWYGIIYGLSPKIIPYTYNAFRIYLASKIGEDPYAGIYSINEFNLDSISNLEKLLSNFVIKRKKSDVPEFKTKILPQPVYFEMDSTIQRIYDAITNYEMDKLVLDENGQISAERMNNSFHYTMTLLDNPELLKGKLPKEEFNSMLLKWKFDQDPRVKFLEQEMKELTEINEKLIIYDNHPATLDLLEKKFIEYNPLVIHGGRGLSVEQRRDIQARFNDKNDPCKLILLSYGTSSSGLNLQYGSHRITFFSLVYDALKISQAMERTDRANSVENSIVKFFIIDKTLDNYRYERIISRVDFNDIFLTKSSAFSRKIEFFDKEGLSRILNKAFGLKKKT